MTTRLLALGGLATVVDGEVSAALASQPVRAALLVFVAVEGRTTRQTVAGLLWPDRDEARARHLLSQTLYQLRIDLGEDVIEAEGEVLKRGPGLLLDASELTEAVAEEDWGRASSLYRGPFLSGVALAGTRAYESWVDVHRSRLERLNRRARRAHVAALREEGRIDDALDVAQDWAVLDPLEDEAQHQVISLLAEGGRHEDALRRYEDHVRALAREDLAPLEELTLLVERIRAARSDPDPIPPNGTDELPVWVRPSPGSTGPLHESRFRLHGGRFRWLGATVLVGAFAITALLLIPRSPADGGLAADRLLVVPFLNETGDPSLDPVGHLAADWLAQRLASVGRLQVVPTIDFIRRDETSALDGAAGEPTWMAVARDTGAGLLVSGRYYAQDDQVELYAQLTDARSGRLWLAVEPVRAPSDAVGPAIEELGRRLMGGIAARLEESVPLEDPSVVHPPTWEAWLSYDRGSRLFIEGDFHAAVPALLEATRRDSSFVRPLLLAASAYGNIGELERQDSLLGALAARSDRLAPYERAHVEWARAELRGDLRAAYAAGRRAVSLAPGGPAHYVFASLTLALGRPRETLEVFKELSLSPAWMPDWWNGWARVAGAYHALALHRQELQEVRRALQTDRRMRTRSLELSALVALGRLEELGTRLDSLELLPGDGVDDFGQALLTTSSELRAHGYPETAVRLARRSDGWYARFDAPTAAQRWTRARTLAFASREAEADSIVTALRETRPLDVALLGFSGMVAARRGDTRRAEAVVDTLEVLDRPYLRGENTYWLAAVAAQLGRTDEALRLLRQAWEEGRTLGFELHAQPVFEPLWDLPGYAALVVVSP